MEINKSLVFHYMQLYFSPGQYITKKYLLG
jgi:hypothetical protein